MMAPLTLSSVVAPLVCKNGSRHSLPATVLCSHMPTYSDFITTGMPRYSDFFNADMPRYSDDDIVKMSTSCDVPTYSDFLTADMPRYSDC